MQIGFIGQGFIGSAYADDFEDRGYETVRYDNEKYEKNKNKIALCDIVFIAVPTPTTPKGFDCSIVEEVLDLVGDRKIAVIKSTILPGTTDNFQKKFPDKFIMHSPEFLRAATAKEDAANPQRNIVGYTKKSKDKAKEVLAVLPKAPYDKIMPVKDAELVKYMGNCFLAQKVVFANLVYDLAEKLNIDYDEVKEAVGADLRIGASHLDIEHFGGRGAGGYCFIKDLAALSSFYRQNVPEDIVGAKILSGLEEKNKKLLHESGKDIDILEGVYGKNTTE